MVKRVSRIHIVVGRFGEEPQTVELAQGDCTVESALKKLNITLSPTDKIWVNGENDYTLKDILEEGDVVNIVGKKEGGSI